MADEAGRPTPDGRLTYKVAEDDSNEAHLASIMERLLHGYTVNEASNALINVLCRLAVIYGVSEDMLLRGVRTGYAFMSQTNVPNAGAPTVKA